MSILLLYWREAGCLRIRSGNGEAKSRMSDETTPLEKLPVLKDDPLFWGDESFDPSQDAFNHEAYAKAIFDILNENEPPLSIGLFGPWGIGKSTVISILFKLIGAAKESKLKPIYFNAWKYSADSFRRQLLIEVAKQVYAGNAELDAKVLRLEQLNYTDVLREEEKDGILSQIRTALRSQVRLREPGVARILLALVVLAVGGIFAAIDKSVFPFASSAFAALLLFFLRLKFEDLFIIQESPVYDPKLIFPEQFEAEFRKLISSSGPIGTSRPVVVIDDIDRCEASTIRDILVSIKTFVGQENCFFIVPCDDRSAIQVFGDPNQKKGYEDELLRKYFNVGVRIAPLMATDLVDFANSVSKRTKIPPSVIQIAILANYRDARKMKHFLNTFAVKYAIAKARRLSGFMPVDIDANLPSFAKTVLIEDLFPELFGKIVEHPEIYEAIEGAALRGQSDALLTKFGLQTWETEYPGLKGILEKTRDIKIAHIEVFLSLKTTNPEAKIPRGWELKNSVVQGEQVAVEEILKLINTDSTRSALSELLIDLLDKTTDTFLKNTISVSLACYLKEDLIREGDKQRLAREISHALTYKPGQNASQHRAIYALRCAADAGGTTLEDLLNKYQKELGELDQPSEGLEHTINALFERTENQSSLSAVLNKRFEQWVTTDKGLTLLTKLQLPSALKQEERLPSTANLEKIATAISAESTPAVIASNSLRKQVLLKYWSNELAGPLADRLVLILQQAQSDATYDPRISFVIRLILDQPASLEPKNASTLWPLVQQSYNRMTDANAKMEIHRAILVFAARCPSPGQQQDAKNFAVQNWQSFSDQSLRDVMSYLGTFEHESGQELQKALVQQQFTFLQNELQNPTDRTMQRLTLCFENTGLLSAQAMQSILLKALETSDNAFTVWCPKVGEFCKNMEPGFAHQVVERCLSLVSGSYTQARRQGFFELFATVLPLVKPDLIPQQLQSYFALCKHSDAGIRNPAVAVLAKVRKEVEEQDFKLGLNTLVRDICRMAPTEVAGYRQVLDSAMEHSAFFGEYEWRDLADLSKRSIQQADTGLQDYGLQIVEKMPRIPAEHEQDLLHLLITVARGTDGARKDRADKILRKVPDSDLGANARKTLGEYLTPPMKPEKTQRS